jgi:Tfp pilus assembly protein PilO
MDGPRLLSLLGALAPVAAIIAAGMQFWDFKSFQEDQTSDFGMKTSQVTQTKAEIVSLEKKNVEMQEFVKAIDAKKMELSELSSKLFELKSALSDRLDAAEFTRSIFTEAKKAGLDVQSIRPKGKLDTEFYREFPFELRFKGVYPQIFTFLNRISNMQRVVRVDQFSLRPISSAKSQFVQLEGDLELKTYAYLGSQADKIADQKKGGQ